MSTHILFTNGGKSKQSYSLNVKRVKKRVNANSLEKEWKPLKNSCYPLEKERNEKKSEIFHSKKSEKRVRVNTSEHHSKMYCPLFNSLKNGHSLAESERHSFSEWIFHNFTRSTNYSLEKEWSSLSASECPLFKDLNGGQYIFEWCSLVFTFTLFSLFFEWKISLFFLFSLFFEWITAFFEWLSLFFEWIGIHSFFHSFYI